MRKTFSWPLLATVCGALLFGATAQAEQHADKADEGSPIFPVEIYACSFHDGKGFAQLDEWVARWNAWIEEDPEPYSAWTLTPFYFGPEQEFDFLWLGASPDAKAMGRAYDKYLAAPELNAAFAGFADCNSHSNFATMEVKDPPDDDAKTFVLNFSDCNLADGVKFDDIAPGLETWSEYRSGHGSQAGMWVLWPAYGGGDADFDFKFVTSYRNYASLGADYDQYGQEGYKKAEELFAGKVKCNDARSYIATERRAGMPESE